MRMSGNIACFFHGLGLVVAVLFWAFCACGEEIPRPEHPMPQMVRDQWLNLNGEWEFAETDDDGDTHFLGGGPYPDRIVVPFCRESKLSGLARTGFVKNVWCRRTFTVPEAWKSKRVIFHVGACDWRTTIWVNGEKVGEHTGGSAAFAFDITNTLKAGANTVTIHAFDDTRSGLQACGKQSQEEKSHGCVYTRTTGIWQTVWLEAVGSSYIRDYFVIPEPEASRVTLRSEVDGSLKGLTVRARAMAEGKEVGAGECVAARRDGFMVIPLSEKRLWRPSEPFLYDLELTLLRGEEVVDRVSGYFGLRRVSVEGAAILINDMPVFQRLILDQGFYPEGIWTAPTDAALKGDIELSMAAGFNGARLHQKVFEPRFLYWADKLGYLVWGEYPSWGVNLELLGADLAISTEWTEIVRRDRNHPAIVGWCPFNETNEKAGRVQNLVTYATRQIDPSRPILDTSGYVHSLQDPELLDAHDYDQNPASLRQRWENALGDMPIPARYGRSSVAAFLPFFVSEYGGIGWNIHSEGWGYGNAPKTLDEFYERYEGLTKALLDNPRMFGFCYTQLTDIEQEQNGLYAYDRAPKFDVKRLHTITSRRAAYEDNPPLVAPQVHDWWSVLVGAFPDEGLAKEWRYTTEPPAEGWNRSGFDAKGWKTGLGGFGKKEGWGKQTRTAWATKDIWLRQEFEFDGADFAKAALVMHYDNATEVYLNGQLVWKGERWNDDYRPYDVTEMVKGNLKKGGNTIAVHCHQDEGGQFIDLALIVARGERR